MSRKFERGDLVMVQGFGDTVYGVLVVGERQICVVSQVWAGDVELVTAESLTLISSTPRPGQGVYLMGRRRDRKPLTVVSVDGFLTTVSDPDGAHLVVATESAYVVTNPAQADRDGDLDV